MNNNFYLINQLLEDGSEASLKLKMIVDFSNKYNNYLFYSKIKPHLREKFYFVFKDHNILFYDDYSKTTLGLNIYFEFDFRGLK